MLQFVNVKKDAAQKPASQTTLREEQVRTLTFHMEELEARVAPQGLPDLDSNGHA